MKGKKVLFTVFCILLCVSIGTVVSAAEKKVIGFIPMTMNNEYFVTMVNAAKIEAEKQGVDLLVQAGERHGSADEQLRIIEDMICLLYTSPSPRD